MKRIALTLTALTLTTAPAFAGCIDEGYEPIPNTGGTACHFVGARADDPRLGDHNEAGRIQREGVGFVTDSKTGERRAGFRNVERD